VVKVAMYTTQCTMFRRAVGFVRTVRGVANTGEQSLEGGAAKQLTHYDSGHIFWFDISRDGTLALARGSESSDVVLIRNFQ
jgi:hypothetical protein